MEDSNKVLEIDQEESLTEKEEEILKENVSVKSMDLETDSKALISADVSQTQRDESKKVTSEPDKDKPKKFLPRQLSHEKYAIGSTLRMAEECDEDDDEEDVDDRDREEREERKEADDVYAEAVENVIQETYGFEINNSDDEDRVTRNTELLIQVMEESKRKRRSSWKSAWDDDDDDNQIDENAEMNDGEQLLWAAENNHLEIITELLGKSRNLINVHDGDEYTPLHRASYNGHIQAVELLLKNGANVKARTQDGWQPLHSACKWNNAEVASILLQNGSDINSQTNGGQTPLHLAASNVDGKETLELLLMHRFIDVTIKNGAHETPFEIAKRSGHFGYLFDIHAKQFNDFGLQE